MRKLPVISGCTLLILAVPLVLQAQEPQRGASSVSKPAWQWTNEERLEARFDPVQMERRNLALASKDARVRQGNYIHGSNTPELFMPWELFNMLQAKAFSIDPEARLLFRESIEENLQTIRLQERFWEALEEVGRDFFGPRQRQSELAKKLVDATPEQHAEVMARIKTLQLGECGRRKQALDAAQSYFGEAWFLKFLYEGVAPGVSSGTSATEDETARILRVQRGCR